MDQNIQISEPAVSSSGSVWEQLLLLFYQILSTLFLCRSGSADFDASAEADDWSAILLFIIFVKCRSTISKMLLADDEEF